MENDRQLLLYTPKMYWHKNKSVRGLKLIIKQGILVENAKCFCF